MSGSITVQSDASDAPAIEQFLGDRQLLVVSNREPYSHEYGEDGDVTVSRPAGGLTAALDPLLQSLGGTWIAWGSGEADEAVVDDGDRVAVPPEDPSYDLRRVWLDDESVDEYYYGYSNQVLWPLCHGLPSKVNFEDGFWETYRDVNERFADAVLAEVDESDPVVWFHDYHFGLAPRAVRDRLGPDAVLAQFWHVPWPSRDAFRRCPRGRELLRGLLANDLLGFHTDRDREQFARCATEALDAEYDPTTGTLVWDGSETVLRAAPIHVDVDAVEERARSEAAERSWRSFAGEHGLADVTVALGVDRLDYTKGIPQRLDALERLWEEYPEWRGELTYVQKGTETRSQIDEYRRLQRRVEDRVAEINDRFGTDDWRPIVYLDEHVSQDALAGLYRHADLALVTPRRDGLNLVAKEFVASQVEEDGVLVLSETAGVADELEAGALTARPLDTADLAETIRHAADLPAAARRRRTHAAAEAVRERDNEEWVADLFRPLAERSVDRGPRTREPHAVVH